MQCVCELIKVKLSRRQREKHLKIVAKKTNKKCCEEKDETKCSPKTIPTKLGRWLKQVLIYSERSLKTDEYECGYENDYDDFYTAETTTTVTSTVECSCPG